MLPKIVDIPAQDLYFVVGQSGASGVGRRRSVHRSRTTAARAARAPPISFFMVSPSGGVSGRAVPSGVIAVGVQAGARSRRVAAIWRYSSRRRALQRTDRRHAGLRRPAEISVDHGQLVDESIRAGTARRSGRSGMPHLRLEHGSARYAVATTTNPAAAAHDGHPDLGERDGHRRAVMTRGDGVGRRHDDPANASLLLHQYHRQRAQVGDGGVTTVFASGVRDHRLDPHCRRIPDSGMRRNQPEWLPRMLQTQ